MKERWEAIRARVAELGRATVRAGVIGANAEHLHPGATLTNGELALLHELGNPSTGLPARSFVRRTFEDPAFRATVGTLQRRLAKAVIEGKMSRDRALSLLGALASSGIQSTITEHKVEPELAKATIEAKGSDVPLVDTGQLAGSVTWELVK